METSEIRSRFSGAYAAAFLSAAVRSLVQLVTLIIKVLGAAWATGSQHNKRTGLGGRDSKTRDIKDSFWSCLLLSLLFNSWKHVESSSPLLQHLLYIDSNSVVPHMSAPCKQLTAVQPKRS